MIRPPWALSQLLGQAGGGRAHGGVDVENEVGVFLNTLLWYPKGIMNLVACYCAKPWPRQSGDVTSCDRKDIDRSLALFASLVPWLCIRAVYLVVVSSGASANHHGALPVLRRHQLHYHVATYRDKRKPVSPKIDTKPYSKFHPYP